MRCPLVEENKSRKDQGLRAPLSFVRMYDRDAIGVWRDKVFVFRSDRIARAGKIETVKTALAICWPRLAVVYDEDLK